MESQLVAPNEAANGSPRKKNVSPGAGSFVHVVLPGGKHVWKAALIPKTVARPDPVNLKRTIEVPVLDEHGKPEYHLCPAAVESIRALNDGREGADSIPVQEYPESGNELKKGIESLADSIREQAAAQREQMNQLTAMFAAVFKERASGK